MDDRKKNEILAFFWFVVSVLTLLSLVSYTPDDIAFEISVPNSPAQNWVGVVGAYTAWALVFLFGKTAYFLVPIFLFWALAKWAGKKRQHLGLKIFSTVIFFSSACALFSLIAGATPFQRFGAGGLIGFFTSVLISNLFGRASIFVALSLFILSIILATELLVLEITAGLIKKSKDLIAPALKNLDEPAPKEKPKSAAPAKMTVMERLKTKMQASKAQAQGFEKASAKDLKGIEPKPVSKKAAEEAKPVPPPPPLPAKPQIKLSIPRPEEPKPKEKEPEPIIRQEESTDAEYQIPPIDLLLPVPTLEQAKVKEELELNSKILEDTLRDFGVESKVVTVEQGPTIVRYELQPAAGVKVQRITSLENDISLAMRATSVRILAPIPGKSVVGIEVPNSCPSTVYLKEVLSMSDFQKDRLGLPIVIGKDTAGSPLVCNLADMPHLLIAGATNTGKSVCINSIITSLLFKFTPDELKFLVIDPKMVEMHFYNDLPHLICPVVTDKAKASGALGWIVTEMERRYRLLSKVGAKNFSGFNEKVSQKQITPETVRVEPGDDEPIIVKKMPYIIVVIDELADLMLVAAQEVETAITRIAQLARAVGIHMILATQRPSVDVITGVIKANFPARIAFQVASKVDSRTILDENGADKLLGRGDLLLMDPRKTKLVRAQGAWVQDAEIEKVTDFIKKQRKPLYQESMIQHQEKKLNFGEFKRDEVYEEAKRIVLETGQASVSMVQRRLGLGYTRAARLIDMMEEDGVVGPYRGAKPREILVERPKTVEEASETP